MEPPRYVVRITGKTHDGGTFTGAGFLVGDEGHVATCWHVVRHAAEIKVHLPYTAPWLYQMAEKSESADLAVLALIVKASVPTPFASLDGSWREDSRSGPALPPHARPSIRAAAHPA